MKPGNEVQRAATSNNNGVIYTLIPKLMLEKITQEVPSTLAQTATTTEEDRISIRNELNPIIRKIILDFSKGAPQKTEYRNEDLERLIDAFLAGSPVVLDSISKLRQIEHRQISDVR
ncbi:MAG: hypothetical protein GY800_07290 [Planctomycetes bacterium]|nr:hypothetical protein [Planctomycetota bacterium]